MRMILFEAPRPYRRGIFLFASAKALLGQLPLGQMLPKPMPAETNGQQAKEPQAAITEKMKGPRRIQILLIGGPGHGNTEAAQSALANSHPMTFDTACFQIQGADQAQKWPFANGRETLNHSIPGCSFPQGIPSGRKECRNPYI